MSGTRFEVIGHSMRNGEPAVVYADRSVLGDDGLNSARSALQNHANAVFRKGVHVNTAAQLKSRAEMLKGHPEAQFFQEAYMTVSGRTAPSGTGRVPSPHA